MSLSRLSRNKYGVWAPGDDEGDNLPKNAKGKQQDISLKRDAPPQAQNAPPQDLNVSLLRVRTRELDQQEQATRDHTVRRTVSLLQMIVFVMPYLLILTKMALFVASFIYIQILFFEGIGPSGLTERAIGCWKDPDGTSCSELKATFWPSLESIKSYKVMFKLFDPSDVYSSTPLYETTFSLPLRHPITPVIVMLVMIVTHYLLGYLQRFLLNIINAMNRSLLHQTLPEGTAH